MKAISYTSMDCQTYTQLICMCLEKCHTIEVLEADDALLGIQEL